VYRTSNKASLNPWKNTKDGRHTDHALRNRFAVRSERRDASPLKA
jgi:hypothetical protein